MSQDHQKTDADTDPIAIRVRGIKTQFGAQVIHDGVDLDVNRGEVIGIVGGSGTGKSVLLRSLFSRLAIQMSS